VGDNGQTVVLEASRTFHLVSRNPIADGEEVQASPAISQGRFLIRTRSNLWSIGR